MKVRPRRFRAITIGGLMALVAMAAVVLSRFRPVSGREAAEVAFESLRATDPQRFRAATLADFDVHVGRYGGPLGGNLANSWSVSFTSTRYPVGVVTTIVGRRRGWLSGPSPLFWMQD